MAIMSPAAYGMVCRDALCGGDNFKEGVGAGKERNKGAITLILWV